MKLRSINPILPQKLAPRPRESFDIFLNQKAVGLFDELSDFGNATKEIQSKIGSELSPFLNLLGEKIDFLTKENLAIKHELNELKSEKLNREIKNKRDKAAKIRLTLISDLTLCHKKVNIVNTDLNGYPDNKTTNFLKSKSRNIAKGFIKPQVKIFKPTQNPNRSNIELTCEAYKSAH